MATLLKDATWQIYPHAERLEDIALEEDFFTNDGISSRSINFWQYLGHWNGEPLWQNVENSKTLLQPSLLLPDAQSEQIHESEIEVTRHQE